MARMERVAIRVEERLRKQIKKAAAKEGVPPSELYRRIFEWGFDQYSKAGELSALRKMAVTSKGKEAA